MNLINDFLFPISIVVAVVKETEIIPARTVWMVENNPLKTLII